MGRAARIIQKFGYDEINVNCDSNSFLVDNPQWAVRIFIVMRQQVTIPVTVKCRLEHSLDAENNDNNYEKIKNFIQVVSEEGGIKKFIINSQQMPDNLTKP